MNELNRKIAKLLGWQETTRLVPTWGYIGNKPFKMPMRMRFYISPDGKEHPILPDWENNEVLAHSLVDLLVGGERLSYGLAYIEIKHLRGTIPHSQMVCKAWIAAHGEEAEA